MATALERLRDVLTANGCNPRGTSARCPAHDDRKPSLSFGPATQFRGAVVHCQVGCHLDDILEKLGLKSADLFDEPRQAQQGYAVVAEYPYRDESGQVLYFKNAATPKTSVNTIWSTVKRCGTSTVSGGCYTAYPKSWRPWHAAKPSIYAKAKRR
jgi:hypothetical protein